MQICYKELYSATVNMPVLFKRNSLSSVGGAAAETKPTQTGTHFKRLGTKRPQEPTESERILATKSETQNVKLKEQRRRLDFQAKVESATKIQRAWRRYNKRKGKSNVVETIQQLSRDAVHKKRVRATQEEWERQIAALTIQLAWRKYFRKKLLKALHPNKRQLQMWDPEIVALKQQALLHYIYNEQIQAPFWHPTLKPSIRPLWLRFVPSPAAVSYNFAVDQYIPWISGQEQLAWPQVEEEINVLQAQCSELERERSPKQKQNSASLFDHSDGRLNDDKDIRRPKMTAHSCKKADSPTSKSSHTRKS